MGVHFKNFFMKIYEINSYPWLIFKYHLMNKIYIFNENKIIINT